MDYYTYYLFFFFKQKTAYEMRISDWSSDVCSSDLLDTRQDWLPPGEPSAGRCSDFGDRCPEDLRPIHPDDQGQRLHEQARIDEIGRASCRERVCQYV